VESKSSAGLVAFDRVCGSQARLPLTATLCETFESAPVEITFITDNDARSITLNRPDRKWVT